MAKGKKKDKKEKTKTQYLCQQNLLSNVQLDDPTTLFDVLEFICSESNKLTNCGIYYARQLWFKKWKRIGKFDCIEEYKTHPHHQALHSRKEEQPKLCSITHCPIKESHRATVQAAWDTIHRDRGILHIPS